MPPPPPETTRREILYKTAKEAIGSDLTPSDAIPDRFACVDQLQAVFKRAWGYRVASGSALYNTKALNDALDLGYGGFERITLNEALPGDIAICATGEGLDPADVGHCWVIGVSHWMSNTSANGLWQANYTKQQVVDDFVKRRGFPLHVYRPL